MVDSINFSDKYFTATFYDNSVLYAKKIPFSSPNYAIINEHGKVDKHKKPRKKIIIWFIIGLAIFVSILVSFNNKFN